MSTPTPPRPGDQPERPKPLSEMTEKERQERLIERFTWDGDTIVWEPNPDDVPDPAPPPGQGEKR